MKDDYKSGFLGQIILGTVVGLAITLAGVLIFALIIDAASLGDGVIKPVNQFIKLLAIFGGCAISIKNEKGFIKGVIEGLSITLLSYLLFGLIGGSLGSFVALLIDVVCGIVMGIISGAVSVNLPRRV